MPNTLRRQALFRPTTDRDHAYLFLPPEPRPPPPDRPALAPDRPELERPGLPLRERARSVMVPLEALAEALEPGPVVLAVAFTALGDAVAVALAELVPELE
jgi:hypothetical protein